MDDHTVTCNSSHYMFQSLVCPLLFYSTVLKRLSLTYLQRPETNWRYAYTRMLFRGSNIITKRHKFLSCSSMNWSLATKNADYVVFYVWWYCGGFDLCRNVVVAVNMMTFIYLPNYTASQPKMPTNYMQQSPFCEANSLSAKVQKQAVIYT